MKCIVSTIFIFTCFNRKYVSVSSVSYNSQGTKAFRFTKTSKSNGSNMPTATAGATDAIKENQSFDFDTSSQLIPRGGDIAGIAAADVAKFYSGLVSLDAVSGTFLPSATCELAGVKVPPKSIRRLTVQAMGGAAGSLCISSFLAVTSKVSSIEKAIAYGYISHVLFLIRGIITNPVGLAQILPNFKIDLLLYVSSIFMILSGLLPAPPALPMKLGIGYKFFSSLWSYFTLSKTGLGSEDELTTTLWQMAHAYTALSSFYAMLVLNNILPVRAVGFTSIFTLVWLIDMVFIKKVQNLCPIKWPEWTYLLAFPIFITIAVGTLT